MGESGSVTCSVVGGVLHDVSRLHQVAHCTLAASNSDLANYWTYKCRGISFWELLGGGRVPHDVSVSEGIMPFTSFHQ